MSVERWGSRVVWRNPRLQAAEATWKWGTGWEVTLSRKETKSCLKHMTYSRREETLFTAEEGCLGSSKKYKKAIQKNYVIN